jgi:CheY-like chemotaxis protein
MTAKRALIVDDSRSARIILGRILESYEMQVDTAESAEEALEYLRLTRPDVIFLDHLMPGMDGFQAIHAIKSNPETAMIPVMMYTSQEGELYLSQARALGAVGVLPKTVKQLEVSRLLSQLRLLPEKAEEPANVLSTAVAQHPARRGGSDRSELVHVETQNSATNGMSVNELERSVREVTANALQEHNVEMRRFMASSLEAFARRINAEQRSPPATPQFENPFPPLLVPGPFQEPARSSRWRSVAAILMLALVPTIGIGLLYTRNDESSNALLEASTKLTSVVEQQQMQLLALQEQVRAAARLQAAAADDVEITSEVVPYGEAPLGGARLDRLRALVDELVTEGFKGKVKVAAYVGEFCLSGNGTEGFAIATEELPWRRCDMIGNPFDDSLPAAQRQTLEFANLISSLRKRSADNLTVEVVYRGRRPSVPYPQGERLSKVTAGEWNRIAAQNNRVEFVTQPNSPPASRAVASDLPPDTNLPSPKG